MITLPRLLIALALIVFLSTQAMAMSWWIGFGCVSREPQFYPSCVMAKKWFIAPLRFDHRPGS